MQRSAAMVLALALVGGCGGGSDTGPTGSDGSVGMDGARADGGARDGSATDGSGGGDGSAASDGSASSDASAFFDGGDAAPGDGAPPDGPWPDGAWPDGAWPDGAWPDAGTVDAGPPPGRLTTGPVDATGGLDLTTVIEGGAMPLDCSVFEGAGGGSLPSGMSLGGDLGCTVTGAPDGSNPPGVYGFVAVVEDDAGRRVEIPVYVEGEPCNTTAVTIDPPAAPPREETAGAAYSWTLNIADIDAPCDGDCASTGCGWCLNMNVDATLGVAANLDCANEGHICSDCDGCASAIEMCPDVVQMTRDIDVRTHAPIRDDGPAWMQADVTLDYSGTHTSPTCGDKHWECHLAVLETP